MCSDICGHNLTCPLHHHLSGRDPSATGLLPPRSRGCLILRREAVSASLTGDTFIFDDYIFMDQ